MKKTENRKIITGLLAAGGSTLVLLPILAPVFFSLVKLTQGGPFMLDYLMPAELFPVAILGGVMLIWAAARARSKRVIIGWSSAIAIISLIGGQLIAVITGLASGATKTGWLAMGTRPHLTFYLYRITGGNRHNRNYLNP